MEIKKSIYVKNSLLEIFVNLIYSVTHIEITNIYANFLPNVCEQIKNEIMDEIIVDEGMQECFAIALCEDVSILSLNDREWELNISVAGILTIPRSTNTVVNGNYVVNSMHNSIIHFMSKIEEMYAEIDPKKLVLDSKYIYKGIEVTYRGEFKGEHLFFDGEMLISPKLSEIRNIVNK